MTLRQIDEIHGITQARQNFNNQKKHFTCGVDYCVANFDAAIALGIKAPAVTLFTESGYLKLVKTFGDDRAWEVQAKLIDCYFHVKQEQQDLR